MTLAVRLSGLTLFFLAAAPAAAGDGALTHLEAFGRIAAENGGNRSAGSPGYDRSADYVADRLKAAGYQVTVEEFSFPYFKQNAAPTLAVRGEQGSFITAPDKSVRVLSYSGRGTVEARVQGVDLGLDVKPIPPSTSGCEPEDFASFKPGSIALMRRGLCPFQKKVENAVAAGAVGAVIMNEGGEGRTNAVPGNLLKQVSIPVMNASFEFGRSIAAAAQFEGVVRLVADVESGLRKTSNVLAEKPRVQGDPDALIMVGAHLDSVAEGPGLNDNGSGSAAVLDVAQRLAAAPPAKATARVRFAFWGAEELGLLGSIHHLNALSEEDRKRISLYINLDMVGSVNFGRFVHGPTEPKDGISAQTRRSFVEYFRGRGLPAEEVIADRRRYFGSDDDSFAQRGVPTVNLYTGASELKNDALVKSYGGQAGKPYDPCYHDACDDVRNVDRAVLGQMTDALEHVLSRLVFEK